MAADLSTFGDYIQEAMASWQIPGAAVAVVQGDEILHMAGYGVRNVETGQPVTETTTFAIASMTKAFTAMGVALLVDEGKVTWDAPVREYLPTFKLKDSYASENLSLRDMLCHRSGMPRHDLAWYAAPFSREELIHNLRYLEPNKTFRKDWEYQNLMYVTAGYVTGLLAGTTWEGFVKERIFTPLDMTASTFTAPDNHGAGDYSMPYRIRRERGEPGRLELMPFYENTVMGPAGSIHSNLSDLVKWLKIHLNEGRCGDRQFVSPGNLEQMHRPQMIMPVDAINETLFGMTIRAYGMGWFIEPYRGNTLVHHGGNIDGFSVILSFMPQIHAGAVILTNADGKPLRDALTYAIYDRLLGVPGTDWNTRYHAIWTEFERAQDQERDTTGDQRIPQTTPSHPLAAYAGDYAADGYADFRVKQENDQLFGWLAGQWWPLSHYHYDVFELHLDRFELHLKLVFQTDTRGAVASVSMPIEPTVKDVVFTRKPVDVPAETREVLAGVYTLPFEGLTLTIKHKPDGTLFAQITGQTDLELIPYRIGEKGVEFNLKDQQNISLAFVTEDGATVALLMQFGQVFRAPRA